MDQYGSCLMTAADSACLFRVKKDMKNSDSGMPFTC